MAAPGIEQGGAAAREVRRLRRLLPLALAVTVLAVALLLVWARLSGEDLRASLARLDWRVLPLAVGLHVTAHLFWAARLAVLAPPFQVRSGMLASWRLLTAGVFGGAVTPGRVGGEALKLTILVRRRQDPAAASALLLLDRSVDLAFFLAASVAAALVLPAAIGAAAGDAQVLALTGSGVLLAFVVLLLLFLWRPDGFATAGERVVAFLSRIGRRPGVRFASRAAGFVRTVRGSLLRSVRSHPLRVAAAVALTIGNWVAEYSVLWVLLRGFGHELPFSLVFLAGIVLTLVANIPVTPGGAAVAEVTAYALLAPLTSGLSILFPLVWRSTTYLYDVVVGGAVTAITVPASFRKPAPGAT